VVSNPSRAVSRRRARNRPPPRGVLTADGAAPSRRKADARHARSTVPARAHWPQRLQPLEPAGGISRGQGPRGKPFRFLLPLIDSPATGPDPAAPTPSPRNAPAASSTARIQRMERNITAGHAREATANPPRRLPLKPAWAMARPPAVLRKRNRRFMADGLRCAAVGSVTSMRTGWVATARARPHRDQGPCRGGPIGRPRGRRVARAPRRRGSRPSAAAVWGGRAATWTSAAKPVCPIGAVNSPGPCSPSPAIPELFREDRAARTVAYLPRFRPCRGQACLAAAAASKRQRSRRATTGRGRAWDG
jgi:hypothetical protein